MNPLGDPLQSVRAVVHRVHRRHHGQQHLRRADVGGGLLPADVLLAGLQGEPERRGAMRIVRHPDQPAGELPLHVGPHGDEPGMRPAETQWHAEPLRRPDRDVGADLTRRAEQGQRQQVGGHRDLRLPLVGGLDQFPVVTNRTGRPRVGLSSRPKKSPDRQRLDTKRRDGFFRVLKDIKEGDALVLDTPFATEKYRVEWIKITTPDDVSVIDPTPERAVTLVGCYPFYYKGSAPQRFIVRAVPVA